MEASALSRQASQQPDYEAVKARVITHAFGFRLGPFGVDYSSRRVEVDPEAKSGRKRREGAGSNAAEGFAARFASAGAGGAPDLKGEPFEAAGESARAVPSPPPDHPDPAWRKGLAAYAKARDILLAGSHRATLGMA